MSPTPDPSNDNRFPAIVTIPAGCFQMGSPVTETDRDQDERQHRVCLNSFELGAKEVTVGEFRRFVEATGYRTEAEKNVNESGCWAYSSNDNQWAWRGGHQWQRVGFNQTELHPVVCVSWNDVQVYLDWLNRQTGHFYRLPTEAEWEYAARGGTQTAYFWSARVDGRACRYANIADINHWDDNFPCEDGHQFTTQIGSYQTNRFGLYDISGNVWE